jgi:predicted nucleotidyltransferase
LADESSLAKNRFSGCFRGFPNLKPGDSPCGAPSDAPSGRGLDLDQIKSTLQELSPFLKSEYPVSTLGIFGSYFRNEPTANSDLDLLVTFSEKPGLFKFISLENYLSDQLGIKVDLVMPGALKNRIAKQIRAEVIPI